MNTKQHRVVLGASAFQRAAVILNERAVECAENEGWPIPADEIEPPLIVARASAMRRATALFREHVRDELHFWSGRTGARRRTTSPDALPALRRQGYFSALADSSGSDPFPGSGLVIPSARQSAR